MSDLPDHDGLAGSERGSGSSASDVNDDRGARAAGGGGAGDGDAGSTLERAVLSESPEGQRIAAGFVEVFGRFVSDEVRPLLREVAAAGDEPQLLVNGLAQLLRDTAEAIEMPAEH